MQNDLSTPLVMSVAEARTSLGRMSNAKFYEILGELESFVLGRKRLVTRASIDAFIERRIAASRGALLTSPAPRRKGAQPVEAEHVGG